MSGMREETELCLRWGVGAVSCTLQGAVMMAVGTAAPSTWPGGVSGTVMVPPVQGDASPDW